jgi:hypothetical protein
MKDRLDILEEKLMINLNHCINDLKQLEEATNGEDIDKIEDKRVAFTLFGFQTEVVVLQGILDSIKEIKDNKN